MPLNKIEQLNVGLRNGIVELGFGDRERGSGFRSEVLHSHQVAGVYPVRRREFHDIPVSPFSIERACPGQQSAARRQTAIQGLVQRHTGKVAPIEI